MLDTFSRELIYKKLPKPIGRTLFVELVSWQPGPGGPAGFYRELGFVPTGEVEDGEIVAALAL